jgi:type IV pilus assembly protein PilW
MKIRYRQTGLTLVEILIALLLGAFLIGGILQIFSSSKQTNRMEENLSRMQENARFAMDRIARDVRQAGYRECLTAAIVPITGTNGATNAPDRITLQQSTGDCVPPAAVAPVTETTTYSIQAGASGRPSLFRATAPAAAVELVEGIQNMQILYGEDLDMIPATGISTDYVANRYVAFGTAGLNRARVVSIRISLLVSSMDDNLIPTIANTFPYNGTNIAIVPPDRRLRRVFTSTIAARNRLP